MSRWAVVWLLVGTTSQHHCGGVAKGVAKGGVVNEGVAKEGVAGGSVINCSFSELTSVPRFLPRDTSSLVLSGNHITELAPDLLPPRLRELDLSGNQLRQLDRGLIFSNLSSLRTLDLSYNEFRTLFGGVFRGLRRLEVLSLAHVQIRYVDEHAFDGLESLRELYLEHNQLQAVFSEWFQDLARLEVLRLDHNLVAHLNGGTFAFLRNLRQLRLSANRIRGVSDTAFVGLETLQHLRLDRNLLTKVPSTSLQAFKKLKTLRLSENAFTEIQTGDFLRVPIEELYITQNDDLRLVDRGSFWDLKNLKLLELHSNPRLEYVDPQAFIKVPNLRQLFLHSNNLSALDKEVLSNFRNSVQIQLHDNPLICDCNILWVHHAIKTENATSGVTFVEADKIKCDRPLLFKERPVRDINDTQISPICAPVIIGPLNSSVSRRVGDKLVFHCKSHAIPPAKVHWVLPGGQVLNDTSNDINIQLNGGTLSLYRLKAQDAGTYMCVAENLVGESYSLTELAVDNIDIKIFPLGVASTFVKVVWNGTARSSFPEYDILYRLDNNHSGDYSSVTVNQFFRSYTINNLRPRSTYEFCIGVRGKEDGQYLQFSCTRVRTLDEAFMLQGIQTTSNVAVGIVCGIVSAGCIVMCLVSLAARKYRQRLYATPEKCLVTNMAPIPLESLHSPLMSQHAGS